MTDDNELNPADMEISSLDTGMDVVEMTLDKFLDTAHVDVVYGEPIQHGDTTIIPCAEVLTGLVFGVGYGMGQGPKQPENEEEQAEGNNGSFGSGGGGGGGGRTLSRPVAVIVASPEGVRVEPVVDVTKIALAALTAFGFMVGMVARMSRGPRYEE